MPEKPAGKVEHYYPKVQAAAVKLSKKVKVGDEVHIVGHGDDFKEKVTSLQLDHQPIQEGQPGQSVGLWVKERVHEGDDVLLVTPGAKGAKAKAKAAKPKARPAKASKKAAKAGRKKAKASRKAAKKAKRKSRRTAKRFGKALAKSQKKASKAKRKAGKAARKGRRKPAKPTRKRR